MSQKIFAVPDTATHVATGSGRIRLPSDIGTELTGHLATESAMEHCDHIGSSGRALLSRHQTSEGTVSYLRCACGAWLVLLEDQPGHRRPLTPQVDGRRPITHQGFDQGEPA
jgi:hypothetical protein